MNHPFCKTCNKGKQTGPEFFQTRLGRIHIETTIPKLSKNIEKLANSLEKCGIEFSPELKKGFLNCIFGISHCGSIGGNDFFKTAGGHNYYNNYIPKLTKLIDKVATEVQEKNEAPFKSAPIGLTDINGEVLREGDTIKFTSSIYKNREFEGTIIYLKTHCKFYIDRGEEIGFDFGIDIKNLEKIKK